MPPSLASTADQKRPCVEDIIIEADEAWAIPMSVCEGIFCCGEATSQTQGVIPRKWAWAIVVWHHHNHKHNSNNNSNSNCDNNTTLLPIRIVIMIIVIKTYHNHLRICI